MKRRSEAYLAASRRDFEEHLESVRGALESEFGRRPARRGWILATIAAAAGLALAWRVSALYRRPELGGGEPAGREIDE